MASSEWRNGQRKIAIVGMGNTLLSDDGIGVHVVEALQEMGIDRDGSIQLVDAATSPDILLSLDAVDKLILIDAADGGCEPGAVYRFGPEEVDTNGARVDSLHEVNLAHTLWMMEVLGRKPDDIVVFGIEPKRINFGLDPSVELVQKIPEIAELVLEEIERC